MEDEFIELCLLLTSSQIYDLIGAVALKKQRRLPLLFLVLLKKITLLLRKNTQGRVDVTDTNAAKMAWVMTGAAATIVLNGPPIDVNGGYACEVYDFQQFFFVFYELIYTSTLFT